MSEATSAPELTTRSASESSADEAAGAAIRTQRSIPLWVKGIAPLVLLGALLLLFIRVGPVGVFQKAFPPIEELTVQRITLPEPGLLQVDIVNGGPEAVTIAQVLVDDAAWTHTLDGPRTIQRLDGRTMTIPYPWVEGEPHTITLVTSTGATFEAEIAVATQTPTPDARYLGTFALLGVYVGVLPVLLGLLWLPFLRGVGRRWLDFFLALTVGLLLFLAFDALAEAIETAAAVPSAFQGLGLVALGLVATPLLLAAAGSGREARPSGFHLALLIAIGIGLHNLGEGLVIGASYATGEIALGTFLVIGFLLHNTTEGLAIVAPLAERRTTLTRLILLGLIAGVPTIAGAWIGGFVYSPGWTTLFFAVGTGAILQVVWAIGRLFLERSPRGLAQPRVVAGLVTGMVLMYATGLFVAS